MIIARLLLKQKLKEKTFRQARDVAVPYCLALSESYVVPVEKEKQYNQLRTGFAASAVINLKHNYE